MAPPPRRRPITGPRVGGNVATVLSLLALLHPSTSQAPPHRFPDAPIIRTSSTVSMAILIIILIAAFGIVGIFTAFVHRWFLAAERQAAASASEGTTDSASGRRPGGLSPETIETFPTMTYAEAKVLNSGLGALECAVCICEFEDEELLRLLPGCCHVFHPHCIDPWLASHVTCPICRSNLAVAAEDHNWLPGSSAAIPVRSETDDPSLSTLLTESSLEAPAPSEADETPPARLADSSATVPAPSEVGEPLQDHVIVVEEASAGEEAAAEAVELLRRESGLQPAPAEPPLSSQSTDHSSTRPGSLEDVDRFTLRLPDHVRQWIFSNRRVLRSTSCAAVFPVTTTGSEERSRARLGGNRACIWSMRMAWSDQLQSSILRTISSTFTPWKRGDNGDSSSTKKGEGGETSAKKREAEDSSSKRMFSALRNSFDWIFGGGNSAGSGYRGSSAGSGCRGATADCCERGLPQ